MLRPWDLDIHIRRECGVSLHIQIVQALIEEIRRGRLTMGTPMPGSRELAGRLQVNRKTVVLAYDELIAQGWLKAQGRRGTFIAAEFMPLETRSATKPIIGTSSVHPDLQNLSPIAYQDEPLQEDLIYFNDGIPDSRIIPYTVLSRAFRHALVKTSRNNQLGYGDPRGTLALRQSLVNMLNMERGLASNEDDICLVRGSQMGIYLAARVLVQPGDCVAFEALSYAPARDAFQACGANIISVAQDQYGLIPQKLEQLCRTYRIKAVYVTPHHQYPTTVTMPTERRLRLLMLAEQFDFYIIEDDYDHEFHFSHRPMLPIASMDREGRVVYIGSISKGLAPGLRVGYLIATPDIVHRCASAVMYIDRQGNPITELAVAELMNSGELKRHLRRALRIYSQRRDAAIQTIQGTLLDDVEFDIPAGGLAFWLRLKHGTTVQRLTCSALQHGVHLMPNEQFSTDHTQIYGMRLGYASLDEDTFKKGIQRLQSAFDSLK